MRARRGFSIVELLVSMTLIGLLATIAMPRYGDMRRRATAAAIIGDVHAIRIGAFSAYVEQQQFPRSTGMGRVPNEMVTYLPNGFTFERHGVTYQWQTWTITSGNRGNRTRETLVGVVVQASDPKLRAYLVSVGSGYTPVVSGNRITFLVANAS
jgi:prepilin-type N-terminal cleavage/methylation domain-containing protein